MPTVTFALFDCPIDAVVLHAIAESDNHWLLSCDVLASLERDVYCCKDIPLPKIVIMIEPEVGLFCASKQEVISTLYEKNSLRVFLILATVISRARVPNVPAETLAITTVSLAHRTDSALETPSLRNVE